MNAATTQEKPTDHAEAASERTKMTYEGHRLPIFVILIWLGFFVFGLAYFVKHLT